MPKGFYDMLDEEKRLTYLTADTRKTLVDYVHSYLTLYNSSPPDSEIILVCKALIRLFKSLGTTPSNNEGIVSIFQILF